MTKMTQEQQKGQPTPDALHAELDCLDAFVVVELAAFLVFVVELAAFAVEFTVNEDYTSDGMNNGWVKVNGQKRQEITLSAPDCYANSPFQLNGNAQRRV